MKKLKRDIFEQALDGNIFAIFGAFQKQARREGWSVEEIDAVLDDAKTGDYDHAIQTLMGHIEL